MNISNRITRSIANKGSDVFVRGEFARFGSAAQVSRALSELTARGALVRLGIGVYARTKPSVLSGRPIPSRPLEVLAPEALRKLGVQVGPSAIAKAYNAGLSTQVPAGIVLNTGKRRISRSLSFNGRSVAYERA